MRSAVCQRPGRISAYHKQQVFCPGKYFQVRPSAGDSPQSLGAALRKFSQIPLDGQTDRKLASREMAREPERAPADDAVRRDSRERPSGAQLAEPKEAEAGAPGLATVAMVIRERVEGARASLE